MSTTHIPASLRRLVRKRAGQICEYCLIHEDDAYLSCHVDHIVAEKHGGLTTEDNLAYACPDCNRKKGSDLGSFVESRDRLVRFYNPRIDRWSEHFVLNGVTIESISEIGFVTVKVLDLNSVDRILSRLNLQDVDRYPPLEALKRM